MLVLRLTADNDADTWKGLVLILALFVVNILATVCFVSASTIGNITGIGCLLVNVLYTDARLRCCRNDMHEVRTIAIDDPVAWCVCKSVWHAPAHSKTADARIAA